MATRSSAATRRRAFLGIIAVLVLATSIITAIAILCMPWINLVLFAGYADDPETFALATLLTQITMPYLVAISAATLGAWSTGQLDWGSRSSTM